MGYLAVKALVFSLILADAHFLLSGAAPLFAFVLAVTLTALSQYYGRRGVTLFLTAGYALFAFFDPSAWLFMPVLYLDLTVHVSHLKTFFLPFLLILIGEWRDINVLLHVLIAVVALMAGYLMRQYAEVFARSKEIQDDNDLQKSRLLLKNQALQEQQTDALYLTKLSERNRIARDIHDNIGHSLSRALLQTGALSAMNADENLQIAIDGLKATLTDSMNVIRNSIHNLKDDAVDLKSALEETLQESKFITHFSYDSASNVPNAVKKLFLIVLKEALTNAHKHSDATEITVNLVEHPAMYQFLIHDNGRPIGAKAADGIGIANIKERVAERSGYVNITTDKGYKIFITIPKKELETT